MPDVIVEEGPTTCPSLRVRHRIVCKAEYAVEALSRACDCFTRIIADCAESCTEYCLVPVKTFFIKTNQCGKTSESGYNSQHSIQPHVCTARAHFIAPTTPGDSPVTRTVGAEAISPCLVGREDREGIKKGGSPESLRDGHYDLTKLYQIPEGKLKK